LQIGRFPPTVVFLEPINRADIRMVERGQNFGFTFESGQPIRVRFKFFRQRFDGNVSTEPRVASAIDLSHSAFTKQSGNFVEAELCADGQSHDFACEIEHRRSVAV
jgi:hypothetical protein